MDFMLSKDIVKRISRGAAQYRAAMDELNKKQPLSGAFKADFCTYYGLDSYSPYKDEEWREVFFGVFEEARAEAEVSFEKVLRALFEKNGNRVEVSSAGKIVANLDLSKPLWDSALLKNLHSEYSEVPAKFSVGSNKEKGIADAVKIYAALSESLEKLLQTPEAEDYLRDFDALFSDYEDLTKEKKVELYLCAKK